MRAGNDHRGENWAWSSLEHAYYNKRYDEVEVLMKKGNRITIGMATEIIFNADKKMLDMLPREEYHKIAIGAVKYDIPEVIEILKNKGYDQFEKVHEMVQKYRESRL